MDQANRDIDVADAFAEKLWQRMTSKLVAERPEDTAVVRGTEMVHRLADEAIAALESGELTPERLALMFASAATTIALESNDAEEATHVH